VGVAGYRSPDPQVSNTKRRTRKGPAVVSDLESQGRIYIAAQIRVDTQAASGTEPKRTVARVSSYSYLGLLLRQIRRFRVNSSNTSCTTGLRVWSSH
jgi:hypothetical protein